MPLIIALFIFDPNVSPTRVTTHCLYATRVCPWNEPPFLIQPQYHATRVTALCFRLHRAPINAARTGTNTRRPHRAHDSTAALN